jgi:putative membrane protein
VLGAARGEASVAGRQGLVFPALLLGIFLCVFVALGLEPAFREDWLLEHVVPFALLSTLVCTVRRLRFSNFAYACIGAFLLLHEIGAHYTYSLVPYDEWWQALSGRSLHEALGWSRNHYDRLMHFLYGLLMMPAALELFAARAPGQGVWRWLPALAFLWSHAVIYELVEWCAALLFGGDLGLAYLGTQGDVWDAQKDMALALSGSACGLLCLARGVCGRPAG